MVTLINKKTVWRSIHGICKPLDELDDSHLANIVQWIKFYMPDHKELLEIVESIMKDRGLSDKFLERSQIPYKNPYGKWEIWDFENHCPIEISE